MSMTIWCDRQGRHVGDALQAGHRHGAGLTELTFELADHGDGVQGLLPDVRNGVDLGCLKLGLLLDAGHAHDLGTFQTVQLADQVAALSGQTGMIHCCGRGCWS